MQPDKTKPTFGKPPANDKDGKTIQAEAQSDTEPFNPETPGSPSDLKRAVEDLKTKIAEAKRRNDLPVDPALGHPGWERSAADGHLDKPDDDQD
jgi:hypothetical protein